MIPTINILTDEITETIYPNRTYKIDSYQNNNKNGTAILGQLVLGQSRLGAIGSTDTSDIESFRTSGYVDGLEAVAQSVKLILSTERYRHIIYSWDYGIELVDLIGKPMPYVMSELPRRITEALTQDNRIDDVVDFEFTKNGKKLHTAFTVVTNLGNISSTLEVEV